MQDGEEIAVLTIGPIGNMAHQAAEEAIKEGINVMHYNMRFIKPLDIEALDYVSSKCTTIITVEDGSVKGGLFSSVSEYIASSSHNIKVIGLGVPDRFIEQGTVPELMQECGYDKDGIYNTIINVARNKQQ